MSAEGARQFRLSRRSRLSLCASARAHLTRAVAHALLDELPEAKQLGSAAVRELRTALNGLNGLDLSNLRSRAERLATR